MNKRVTKGPWRWRQNPLTKTWALMAPQHGGTLVMDFCRKGMRDAQPRFGLRRENMGGEMYTADQLGDQLLNHPDFKLLEASHELFELCKGVIKLDAIETDPLMSGNKRKLFITQLVSHAENLVKRIEGDIDEN